MSETNNVNFARLRENGEICLTIGEELMMEGLIGNLHFADGSITDSSAWKLVNSRTSTGHDRGGRFDRLEVICQTLRELRVKTTYTMYHDEPVLSIQTTVTNMGNEDVFLAQIGLVHCKTPEGGVDAGFRNLNECTIRDQTFYWTGHKQLREYLYPLTEEKRRSYWDILVSESCGRSLVAGVGGPATGKTEIWVWQDEGKMGIEIASALSTTLDTRRKLRIPPGNEHTTEMVLLVWGDDPWQTLQNYAVFTCQLLNWEPKPPYAGLFSAYGSDPDNGDPGLTPLTEKRIEELITVVDKYLKPYGLDTIKTQYRGISSSGFEKKIGAEEVETPAAAQLIDTIREKGWSGDGITQDFPHGIPWHIEWLKSKGYRPALVCRPFLNIKAGTPELDKAAADLFEMTIKEWGYEYLMLDFNSADYESEVDTLTVEEGIYRRFRAIRERVGPDIFIEACMVWPGPVIGIADGFRPGHDWRGGLEHELMEIFASRYHYHNRFFQLDNEFFDPAIFPFTWGAQGIEGIQLSCDRVRMWVSFCGLLGMSFLGGAALEKVSPDRWHLFQRALPVVGGLAKPVDFMRSNPPKQWRRDAATQAGNFSVLGFFNYDEDITVQKMVPLSEWGLSENVDYLIFDFWTECVYGPTREFPVFLAPFSCHVLFVQPMPSQPALLGSTRHVAGEIGLEEWRFDRQSAILEAVVSGAPNSQERYYIWLPDNEGVIGCIGADFEIERPQLVRLEVDFDSTGRREWSMKLDKNMPVL